MRTRSVATTVAALTVGLTAATALHRRAARRLPVPAIGAPRTAASIGAPTAAPAPTEPVPADLVSATPVTDGVVLPFVRPADAAPAQVQPATPARCGDSGGVTKAGAPCAARPTTGGRCRHHPLAA